MPSARGTRYQIVEPHPSVPSTSYVATGRGGAGNAFRVPTTVTRGVDATGPASRASIASLSMLPQKAFSTGRGGAGNVVHPPSERAIFSFDEELALQLSLERHAAPVYHVGRGGAGNVSSGSSTKTSISTADTAYDSAWRSRKTSDDSGSQKSTSSAESGADVATRNIKKGWKKLTGNY